MISKTPIKYIWYILSGIAFLGTASVLFLMGQPLVAKNGKVYLWSSAGGGDYSQHFSDWYSFSHFLHGVVFFILLTKLFKKVALEKTFFIAVLIESGWEILENSPIIIDRYRQTGIAAGYFGDSVLNSVGDILFMMAGFFFVKRFGVKAGVGVFIFLELLMLYLIRDNLTLNIIMLLYPFKFISDWQMGI